MRRCSCHKPAKKTSDLDHEDREAEEENGELHVELLESAGSGDDGLSGLGDLLGGGGGLSGGRDLGLDSGRGDLRGGSDLGGHDDASGGRLDGDDLALVGVDRDRLARGGQKLWKKTSEEIRATPGVRETYGQPRC